MSWLGLRVSFAPEGLVLSSSGGCGAEDDACADEAGGNSGDGIGVLEPRC